MTPQTPWSLTTYSTGIWTDLVPAVATATVLKALSVAVGINSANVQVRIVKSNAATAMIVPASALGASIGYTLDIAAITLGAGDALQVQCDVAGVQFMAFGAQ